VLELLALRRQGVGQGRAQAVGGRVAVDEDAVAVLEAGGEGGACGGRFVCELVVFLFFGGGGGGWTYV